jgi:hypothetical protein
VAEHGGGVGGATQRRGASLRRQAPLDGSGGNAKFGVGAVSGAATSITGNRRRSDRGGGEAVSGGEHRLGHK